MESDRDYAVFRLVLLGLIVAVQTVGITLVAVGIDSVERELKTIKLDLRHHYGVTHPVYDDGKDNP